MRFPTEPVELKRVLKEEFGKAKGLKITQCQWEVWSGEFNRHLRKLTQEGSNRTANAYLYAIWQSVNRLLLLYARRRPDKGALRKERKLLDKLKGLFQDSVDGIA